MARRYSDRAIIKALQQTRGLIAPAAAALGCDEMTIRRRVREVPEVASAMHEARAGLLDLAESKLLQAIENGEAWAISLTLRTIGRDRGYGDAVALTGPGGGPMALVYQEQESAEERLREKLEQIRERLLAQQAEDDS